MNVSRDGSLLVSGSEVCCVAVAFPFLMCLLSHYHVFMPTTYLIIRLVASVCQYQDHQCRVWDVASGQTLREFQHDGAKKIAT